MKLLKFLSSSGVLYERKHERNRHNDMNFKDENYGQPVAHMYWP